MDNIQNPQFQVDGSRNGNFSSVSATVMQEDFTNNTTDFRMQVPSENAIIRCNMYVIPMGRDVIFYITVGNLQSGSGDFVTSITVQEPEPEPEQPAVTTPQTQTPSSQTSSEQTPSSSQTPSSAAPSSSETSGSEDPGSDASSEDSSGKDSSTGALGLEEFDASGNKVSDTSTEAEQGGGTGNPIVWWVIGGIIVAAIAGGCVWYFCFFRKKK